MSVYQDSFNKYTYQSPMKSTTSKLPEDREYSDTRYQESPGTKLLKYVKSEYFGQKTEPVKEFVVKMLEENEKLSKENYDLHKSNTQFEEFLRNNEMETLNKDNFVGYRGQEISQYDCRMLQMESEEVRAARIEKMLDRDTQDLVEYVKWITNDLGLLRDRVRIAEKIINDLRKSGEESVESLLNNLYTQKKRQEEVEQEADNLRDVINTKEYEISIKEEEVNKLKRLIELETSEKETEIKRIRHDIDEQQKVLDNQRKIIQELQILNDFTQQDMIKVSKDLQKRNQEKTDLQLRYYDQDQETTNLKFKQNTLEEQLHSMKSQYLNTQGINPQSMLNKNASEKQSPRSGKKEHGRSRSQLAVFYVQ
ncbi:UNKNOWN [Stylonychia lemnae]|uniref:Uncharacterized protein n=1 Tax=Stylonychia lemnae TaxID=5949 RepID=A0A078AM70_STYLE|nr:UNKNOWN [Stylonychia lemnae]|eukprot:CDW82986.1 UNKNOWN [Stylonychia lemnae]